MSGLQKTHLLGCIPHGPDNFAPLHPCRSLTGQRETLWALLAEDHGGSSCPIVAHDCSLTFPSLSLLEGLTFQAEVIQETSLTTIAGEKVTLICGSSAGVVTTSNYADWVQRKPYQGRLIGDHTHRDPSVLKLFSGAFLGGKSALTITRAQPEDEALHHCAAWFTDYHHRDSSTEKWHSNLLAQLSALPRAPSFFLVQRLVLGLGPQDGQWSCLKRSGSHLVFELQGYNCWTGRTVSHFLSLSGLQALFSSNIISPSFLSKESSVKLWHRPVAAFPSPELLVGMNKALVNNI